MKKYVKPELFFESYEVNQNIAACSWDLNHADKHSCHADFDPDRDNQHDTGVMLFTQQAGTCNVDEEDMEEYCYTNGAGMNNRVFQS